MKKLITNGVAVLLAMSVTMQAFAAEGIEQITLDEKIESLFANEGDTEMRNMEVETFKAEVSDRYMKDETGDEYEPYVTIDNDDRYVYVMGSVGLMGNTIRYSLKDNDLTLYTRAHTAEEQEQNQAGINYIYEFVSDVKAKTTGMSEAEKIKFLNQTVIDTLEYNYEKRISGLNESLRTKTARCLGYSNLFHILAINCGIRCEVVGNAMHAFNRVQLQDGSVYYVDTCWNDTSRVSDLYFMMDDARLLELGETHKLDECFVNEF